MNRKKKITSTLKKKAKKANAKLKHNNKPKYIAKALREKALPQDALNLMNEAQVAPSVDESSSTTINE